VLLLLRVGVVNLRQYFKNQWNVSGCVPWTDCKKNGTDLLSKFKPLKYERGKVKCGDTSKWDLSLIAKALLHSTPPLVSDAWFITALECLINTRNKLCHAPSAKIVTSEFNKLWSDACNALLLFGASSGDFKKVEEGM